MRFVRLLALAGLLVFAACTQTPAPRAPAAATPDTAGSLPAASRPATVSAPAPRDAFVVLSGGGTPLSNNYSQFLQARALTAFLGQQFPQEARWVFFGAGNREGEPPLLADARRQVRRDGLLIETWVPGALPANRPATRESFLRALREEILPTVRGGGTLFLFVGDHGEQAAGGGESAITLWQWRRGRRGNWREDDRQILGVDELRATLTEGIGRGRVVFLMTQCHSGGFHFLSVPRQVTPSADWFERVPDWAKPGAPAPALAAAGFTATDENSIAAGCDPDPDPDNWAGYERFAPEQLLGMNLFTLAANGTARPSFAAAHDAATLVDHTIDKPRASSDQFLAQWADAIERMEKEPALTAPARAAVSVYRSSVDSGRINPKSEALRAKQEQFARFTQRASEQVATGGSTLLSGTRGQLDQLTNGERRGGDGDDRGERPHARGVRRAWRDTIRPAWKRAVVDGRVAELTPVELAFEKRLLALEDRNRDTMFGDGDVLLSETYAAGYADLARFDPVKAETIARWGTERRERIARWAKNTSDAALRAAGETLFSSDTQRGVVEPASRELSARTAAERVLFYRRVLAAGEFLETMQHRAALDQLAQLIALEQTPLPASAPAAGPRGGSD